MTTALGQARNLVRLLGWRQSMQFLLARQRGVESVLVKPLGVSRPVRCRTRGSDIRVLWQTFGKRECDIPLEEPVHFILDGGANVGYTSLLYALAHPTATVVAVEPDPANCALIRENCGHLSNVVVLEAALWSHSTLLEIENPEAEAQSFRVREVETASPKSLQGLSIPDLLERFEVDQVDLMKLDVEGAEQRIFSADVGWLPRVRKLAVELHDRHAPGCTEAVYGATGALGMVPSRSGEFHVFSGRTSAP